MKVKNKKEVVRDKKGGFVYAIAQARVKLGVNFTCSEHGNLLSSWQFAVIQFIPKFHFC